MRLEGPLLVSEASGRLGSTPQGPDPREWTPAPGARGLLRPQQPSLARRLQLICSGPGSGLTIPATQGRLTPHKPHGNRRDVQVSEGRPTSSSADGLVPTAFRQPSVDQVRVVHVRADHRTSTKKPSTDSKINSIPLASNPPLSEPGNKSPKKRGNLK